MRRISAMTSDITSEYNVDVTQKVVVVDRCLFALTAELVSFVSLPEPTTREDFLACKYMIHIYVLHVQVHKHIHNTHTHIYKRRT